jgi:ketosteroid isomerase-like protein
MGQISPEKVRAEIKRFWLILSGKSQDRLEELYSTDAIIFTGKAKRPEPAMLAIARRSRRAPLSSSSASAEVGAVEMQIAGDVAIASYTYQYQEERTAGNGIRSQRNTLYGRATQVFQAGSSGTIKIVHEHLSAAVPPDEARSSAQ